MFNYPNFKTEFGYLTKKYRNEFIQEKINYGELPQNSFNNKKITSLIAPNDKNDELYFWQLYSIIGEPGINKIITIFYYKIFNDKNLNNKWFKDEFIETGTIEHHINGQKKFWIDVMGGGKTYFGKETKLNLRHQIVNNIMIVEGADLWFGNIMNTFNGVEEEFNYDKRIIKTCKEFIIFFMKKYSLKFNFNITNILNISKL